MSQSVVDYMSRKGAASRRWPFGNEAGACSNRLTSTEDVAQRLHHVWKTSALDHAVRSNYISFNLQRRIHPLYSMG